MASSERTSINSNEGEGEVTDYNAIFPNGTRKSQFAKKTFIGEFRNPRRFHWIEWVFLSVATLSMLGVLALTIERFVTYEKKFYNLTDQANVSIAFKCTEWYCTADFTFALVVLINLLFCFFYCYDGLFRERQFELLAFVGATGVIFTYVVGSYIFDAVRHNGISDVKNVRLALMSLFAPVNIVLAILSWWKMGYLVFNVIGANKLLSDAYQIRSFFATLQYFHVEIMANVLVLSFALSGTLLSTAEMVIISLLFVYLLLVVFLGLMAMSWESKGGVVAWYVVMVPLAVYYVYKLVEVSIHWSEYTTESKYELHYKDSTSISSSMKFVGVALLLAVSLGLVSVLALAVAMAFVFRNFNLGLRNKVDPPFSQCPIFSK